MKESPLSSCPKCGADFTEARQLLKEETLAFCLRCKFPLVLIAGKYRLEKELAQGGYGVVYKARHIYLEQDSLRVVKILKPEVFQIPGMEQRFYREVQVTSALSQKDEHIIRIYDDFGKNANIGPFYVMEYLEGLRLDALLVQSTHLPMLSFVMHIVRQLCQSIQLAHDAGIVHRDLKPENLYLVERRGDPYFLKIIDFGIAKPFNQEELKMTQGVLGSPFYMAPEQCLNQQVDARTDIYAIGCITFELLTGFPPFHPKLGNTQASSLVEMLGAHVGMPPPNPRELRPERVSENMAKVLLCALEKNPAHRYQSARSLLEALEEAHEPLLVPDYTDASISSTLPTGEQQKLPLERVHDSPRPTHPTADFPMLDGVPAAFDFSDQQIFLGGDQFSSPSWDELDAIDASDTVIRSFFRTVQNTMRDEEGIRYYRAIFVLSLFLMSGVMIGWWVFFFTHGGQRSSVLASAAKDGGAQTGTARKMPPDRKVPSARRPVSRDNPVRAVPPRMPLVLARTQVAGRSNVAARARSDEPTPRGRVLQAGAGRRHHRRRWRRRHYSRRFRRRRAVARVSRRAVPRVQVVPPRRPQQPVRPPAPRNPIKGCPAASPGVRWVRLDVHPSHITASTRIFSGIGQAYRRSFGFCLGLRSGIQLRIEANEFRPCIIPLSHKHAHLAIHMKKDRMDAIETDHKYCLR